MKYYSQNQDALTFIIILLISFLPPTFFFGGGAFGVVGYFAKTLQWIWAKSIHSFGSSLLISEPAPPIFCLLEIFACLCLPG